MKCCYLSVYSSELFSWQVAACQARQGRYVPSLSDLEKLCRNNHALCPYYLAARAVPSDPRRHCESVAAFAA